MGCGGGELGNFVRAGEVDPVFKGGRTWKLATRGCSPTNRAKHALRTLQSNCGRQSPSKASKHFRQLHSCQRGNVLGWFDNRLERGRTPHCSKALHPRGGSG